MHCQPVTERRQWNEALLTLGASHVLQSWDWGKVKEQHGWTPIRFLWTMEKRPVAAAQVLRRPLPHTPWGVMYVPKGPVLDFTDPDLLTRVLSGLEAHARRQRAVFVKIDPDTDLPEVKQSLLSCGWRYSAEQIQFRNTALLDLVRTESDLLAAMKSKTRYNVRLAARRGVTVRAGTGRDIPRFYEMYAETGARDGFLIRPFEYYRDAWQTFLDNGLGHMLLAQVEDEPIAGLILFRFGTWAWYMYGASTNIHRNRMPNYALQWAAIRWLKSVGCTMYDMWGAPDTLDESDRMWNVWRFKEGLGAKFAPRVGAHDRPTSQLLYWAYTVILPRYLDWLRSRHGQGR